MNDKTVPPQLGAKSFSCPHCGAVAHQTWFKLFRDGYDKDECPWVPDEEVIDRIKRDEDLQDKEGLINLLRRKMAKEIFLNIMRIICISNTK